MGAHMSQRRRTFFHGGVPGLREGSRIRPAASLKKLPPKYEMAEYDTDPNRVFLTVDRRLARAFAAQWLDTERGRVGGGDLYQVTAKGPLHPDPDYAHYPGKCVTAPLGIVTTVLERGVQLNDDLHTYAQRFTTWSDGPAMYDAHGFAQPSAIAAAIGVTAEHLRPLGRNPEFPQIEAFLQSLTRDLMTDDPSLARRYVEWHQANSSLETVVAVEAGLQRAGVALKRGHRPVDTGRSGRTQAQNLRSELTRRSGR